MKVLLAGGRGFLGTALARELRAHGHEALILSRHQVQRPGQIHWDGHPQGPWSQVIEEVDAVVNATGYGLEHWPWSPITKAPLRRIRVSCRGKCLAAAIQNARHRPASIRAILGHQLLWA